MFPDKVGMGPCINCEKRKWLLRRSLLCERKLLIRIELPCRQPANTYIMECLRTVYILLTSSNGILFRNKRMDTKRWIGDGWNEASRWLSICWWLLRWRTFWIESSLKFGYHFVSVWKLHIWWYKSKLWNHRL